MTTTVINSVYENGQRVVTQKVEYDKSDDLFTLANLQRRYERMCQDLEVATTETEIQRIQENIAEIQVQIEEQQKIVDGYEEASE